MLTWKDDWRTWRSSWVVECVAAMALGLVSSIVKGWQNQNFIQSTAEFSVIEYRMFIDKIVGGSSQRTFLKKILRNSKPV